MIKVNILFKKMLLIQFSKNGPSFHTIHAQNPNVYRKIEVKTEII